MIGAICKMVVMNFAPGGGEKLGIAEREGPPPVSQIVGQEYLVSLRRMKGERETLNVSLRSHLVMPNQSPQVAAKPILDYLGLNPQMLPLA